MSGAAVSPPGIIDAVVTADGPLAKGRGEMTDAGAEQPRPRILPGIALLVLTAVIAAGILAMAWVPSVGDGRSQVCRDRGTTYIPALENWSAEAATSWLPMGVTCTWTGPTAGDTIREEPGWTPTLLAAVPFVLGSTWVTVVGWGRARRATTSQRR